MALLRALEKQKKRKRQEARSGRETNHHGGGASDVSATSPAKQARRPCCKWQRHDNDSVMDPSTSKAFCTSCWQMWILDRLPKAKADEKPAKRDIAETDLQRIGEGGTQPPTERNPDSADKETSKKKKKKKRKIFYSDEDLRDTDTLEGEVVGTELYLVLKNKKLAFSSERTEDGLLRRVGRWSKGKLKLDPEEQELDDTGGGDTSTSVNVKESNSSELRERSPFPYEVDDDDHCETPPVAFADLAPVLEWLAKLLGKDKSTLQIYDPYFCDGKSKRCLQALGFEDVYNEKEDFYARMEADELPEYDILVTNPPYSTSPKDHIDILTRWICKQTKPWFIIQPNYVYTKDFWLKSTASMPVPPIYLVPPLPREYVYKTPTGLRALKSKQMKTSPFVTFWYCWLGSERNSSSFFKWWSEGGGHTQTPLRVACNEFNIPDNFKDSSDKTRRKKKKSKKGKGETEEK